MKKIILVISAIISFIFIVCVGVIFFSLYSYKEKDNIHSEIIDPEYSFQVTSEHFSVNGKANIKDDLRELSFNNFKIVNKVNAVDQITFLFGINHDSFYNFSITSREFKNAYLYINYKSCSVLESGEMCQQNSFTKINEQDFKKSLTIDIQYCLDTGSCLTEKTDINFND